VYFNFDTGEQYSAAQLALGGTGLSAIAVRDGLTVTPEPVSTVLFLLGGAPIAVNLYRKKNRALKV
jgi:hypothetical protein